MFSTYDGAKRLAKKLRKAAFEHGADLALNVCQRAVAAGGGYRDWRHLRGTLETGGALAVEPEAFKRRLRVALPMLSEQDANAVFGKLRPVTATADDRADAVRVTAYDVLRMHATRALFRQGSGPGLRMRNDLINALQRFETATYDGTAHTLAFEAADLREIFGGLVDDPRFRGELAKIIDAGVVALEEASDGVLLELLSPPQEEIEEHVRAMERYERQLERRDEILRPTELTSAQRAMLELAQKRPLRQEDRAWVHNDLTTLFALIASGAAALEPANDDGWRVAITAAGKKALRRRIKPAQDSMEATLLRCMLGRLIVVGTGAADPNAPWRQDMADVPADGVAIYAFARKHGLAIFGAVRAEAPTTAGSADMPMRRSR